MFDPGLAKRLNGSNDSIVDQSADALSMSRDAHDAFTNFDIFFEAIDHDQQPHTYKINCYDGMLSSYFELPQTVNLSLAPGHHSVDPPCPRLLKLHRAVSSILHLSGAGEYIGKIMQDMDEGEVSNDGVSALGPIVSLMLADWDSNDSRFDSPPPDSPREL